jgi:plasmid stabilization system protein ParE
MPWLIWSPQAWSDVQRLYRVLETHELDAVERAVSAVSAIRQRLKVLEQQPTMGRPRPDMPPEFSECLLDFGDSGYVALSRLVAKEVVSLAVRHQREAAYRRPTLSAPARFMRL